MKPDYLGLNPGFVTYWLFELGSLPGTQCPGFLLLSEGQVVIVPTLEAVVRTEESVHVRQVDQLLTDGEAADIAVRSRW